MASAPAYITSLKKTFAENIKAKIPPIQIMDDETTFQTKPPGLVDDKEINDIWSIEESCQSVRRVSQCALIKNFKWFMFSVQYRHDIKLGFVQYDVSHLVISNIIVHETIIYQLNTPLVVISQLVSTVIPNN